MAVQSKEIECLECDAVYYIQHDMRDEYYVVTHCSFCGCKLELESYIEFEDEEEFE